MAAVDIGHGVSIEFTSWADHEKVGLTRTHPKPDGGTCTSGLLFDLAGVREAFPDRALWVVEQWEPLTLSPSLLCRACNHHGWIRAGRWEPA